MEGARRLEHVLQLHQMSGSCDFPLPDRYLNKLLWNGTGLTLWLFPIPISPRRRPPKELTFMMFAFTVLCFSFFLSLVHASPLTKRDVFNPHITSPDANTEWPVGTQQTVTWYDLFLINPSPTLTHTTQEHGRHSSRLAVNKARRKGFIGTPRSDWWIQPRFW